MQSEPRKIHVSGKTTLLKHCLPAYRYVSLDLPSKAEQAERNPDDFLREHPDPVIVDEVQDAPALFRHLNVAIDQRRYANGRFLLTGSQHFILVEGVSDSLAGRIGLVDLESLALAELPATARARSKSDLINLMARGQFPELWRVPEFPTGLLRSVSGDLPRARRAADPERRQFAGFRAVSPYSGRT